METAMKSTPIGLGVIGFGYMGRTFEAVKGAPDLRYQIRAVCGSNADKIRLGAQQAGVAFWTTDYRELVKRKDIDVVAICSPDPLHAQHALAAIEAGKHVVCCKPSSVTLEEAKDLVKQVRSKGVRYLAAYTLRQDQQYFAARQLLDDGDLGRLIALEGHYLHDMRATYESTPWRLQAPQDMLFGGCMHIIDILRAFAGDVESVHAFASIGHLTPTYPIPDNFYINMKFKSGAIGRVSGLYGIIHPPQPMHQFNLYGSKGSLVSEFGPSQMRMTLEKLGCTPLVTSFSPEPESSRFWYGPNIVRTMRQMQNCLDHNREPDPGVVESAKSIAVGAAAWESIQTGQPVTACNEF
jgi:predicted dehydrogenase